MRKVRSSEFRSFVRRVLSEAEMKRNPETTGRTAYDVVSKLLYVEWDDGDKKSIAVYNVTGEADETPWFDYNGDNSPDKNPARLTYKETVTEFPNGLKILTPNDAIAAAKEYKRKNPNTDINTVNLLSNPFAGPKGVRVGAEKNLVSAAGGTLQTARPDFYKRKADAKGVKASPAGSESVQASASAAVPAQSGGSRTGISSSPVKSSVRVKKGEYGFTLKFNNASRGPITIFVYLLSLADGQGLGMQEDKIAPGPRDIPTSAESGYVNKLVVQPGATINIDNLFGQEGFTDAKTRLPGKEYVFLRYYRGVSGKDGEVNWSKTAGTSLSRLSVEREKK